MVLARRAGAFALAAFALAACETLDGRTEQFSPDPGAHVRGVDFSARPPQAPQPGTPASAAAPAGPDTQPVIVRGADGPTVGLPPSARGAGVRGGGRHEINLEATDIGVAARTILGETLGLSYAVDPRVQGTVTVVTARPVTANELLSQFEAALQLSNVLLVREGTAFRLIPAGEPVAASSLDGQGPQITPGYGLSVLPLRYVSGETLVQLLENFGVKPGSLRYDASRNALLIQGTAPERRMAIEAAQSFDQDWMANQSVGVFPVRNVAPDAILPELERVFDMREGGRGQSTIRIQTIARLNALLVVARSRALLDRAAFWIAKLDRADTEVSNLRVYHVQHGDAAKLAQMMNAMFASGGQGLAAEAATQLPPGSQLDLSGAGAGNAGPNGGSGAGGQNGQTGQDGQAAQPASQPPAQQSAISVQDKVPESAGGAGAPSGGGGRGPVLPDVRITANPENNTLLIYARGDSHRIIEQALSALDKPAAQVAIEATIAEVSLTNDLRYGVQYFLSSKDLDQGTNRGSVGLFGAAGATLARSFPGFNLLLGPQNEPRLVLDALRSVTDVRVLSSPAVVVMDNKVANLVVGDEVPITTRTAVSVTDPDAPIVNNIEFRRTGVILNVLPRITANGTVNLQVEQEISSVPRSSGGANLTPTISQRRIRSTIAVPSGQTVMLGGLISERASRGQDGLPVLGDLPVVGDLFRSNSSDGVRSELIILIRPQIIRDPFDAQAVAEQMRGQLRLMNSAPPAPLRRPQQQIIE